MEKAPTRGVFIIIGCFLLLGLIYSFATPIFEASDELNHYPFVAHLAQGNGLPRQDPGRVTGWGQEGSQPPLYYALAAALTFWVNTDDLPVLLDLNPHAKRGIPLAADNKNMIVHTDRERLPWRGTVLAVALVRFFSLLLGAGTVGCTFLLARRLLPDEPGLALMATAFNAFLPMFLFISASVNNDNLVVFLASLALLWMVAWVQEGGSRWSLPILGGLIGLACLSKLSGLALLPLAGLALALPFVQKMWATEMADRKFYRAALTGWLVDFGLLLLPALLVAGWWYLRNWQLYGEPTGLAMMLDVAGRRPDSFVLADLLGEFQGFRINYWGLFGAVNVLMRPLWVYQVLDLFTLLAALGLGLWGWRLWRGRAWKTHLVFLIPAAWIVLEFVGLIRWTSLTAASQGRLLFPTISAISLFLALGWSRVLPRRWRRSALPLPTVFLAPAIFLGLLALSAPFTAIRPAYPGPEAHVVPAVPPTAQPYFMEYGGKARLLAFEVDKSLVHPGDTLKVTLYWLALAPMDQRYSVFVQLFGQDLGLGQSDSYPGGGMYPTTHWQPGQIIRDVHHIFISGVAPGLRPAWIAAGIYDFEMKRRPQAIDAAGGKEDLAILTKLQFSWPISDWQPANPVAANFANQVQLLGYDAALPARPGGAWEYTLYWQATAPLERDYTLFVHLLDANNVLVGQGDSPPLQGVYPTSRWQPGEILNDAQSLPIAADLPSGKYRVVIGLYDPATGTRLPVLDENGQITGDSVLLATLDIRH